MEYTVTVDIAAPPERVWAVLADVARWPDWSQTVTSVRRRDDGEFGRGSVARITQPKLPAAVWRVTTFERGRAFNWASTAPGIRTDADHRIEPLAGGRSRVTLRIGHSGPLAPLLTLLLGAISRRYVALEADCLKRHCERADDRNREL